MDAVKDSAIDAMQALFDFSEAMNAGQLTIGDLRAVMELSIDDAHDFMGIQLAMAQLAISKCSRNVEAE